MEAQVKRWRVRDKLPFIVFEEKESLRLARDSRPKNYNVGTDSFHTTFSEISVARCEARRCCVKLAGNARGRLRNAAALADEQPGYAYTCAVALQEVVDVPKALNVLIQAGGRYPGNREYSSPWLQRIGTGLT